MWLLIVRSTTRYRVTHKTPLTLSSILVTKQTTSCISCQSKFLVGRLPSKSLWPTVTGPPRNPYRSLSLLLLLTSGLLPAALDNIPVNNDDVYVSLDELDADNKKTPNKHPRKDDQPDSQV